ncbi:MAG: DUF2437 domain-containing protein [Methanobrevibacter sp.]|jgi:hypothetical protein|nr:DUF2437 domain-containing protein [Methanobrevibacter sp.]
MKILRFLKDNETSFGCFNKGKIVEIELNSIEDLFSKNVKGII